MADIELIIRMPKEDYERIKNSDDMNFNVIKNGTPLPKGHGRLIDADKMKSKMLYSFDIGADIEMNGTEEVINNIFNDAPTIIEADKENRE